MASESGGEGRRKIEKVKAGTGRKEREGKGRGGKLTISKIQETAGAPWTFLLKAHMVVYGQEESGGAGHTTGNCEIGR